jgi:hypothetical protein
MTHVEWEDFCTTIAAHPLSKVRNALEFAKASQIVCHPISEVAYSEYQQWESPGSIDGFFQHFAIWPSYLESHRAMSTIVIIIDTPAKPQTYTVTARGAYYTRWPLTTLLGQQMGPAGTASPAEINKQRDAAEASGQGLKDVEEVSAITVAAGAAATAAARAALPYAIGLLPMAAGIPA